MAATEVYKVKLGERYEAPEGLGTFTIVEFITPKNMNDKWKAKVQFDNPHSSAGVIPVTEIITFEKVDEWITYEWRDTRTAGWQRGRAAWTRKDISFFNRACGYEKYRIVG